MSNKLHNKRAIAQAFGRAAQRYTRFAELQRTSGEHLMTLALPLAGQRILDAGCGTGHFSQRWSALGKQVIALDLSAGMLQQAVAEHSADAYVQGDIEHLPLADARIDLCFSNLAVQWCEDLPRAIATCYRATRPGGAVVFSTLAEDSLGELAQAWLSLDGSKRVNDFLPLAQIAYACRPYRHRLYPHTLTYRFATVSDVMHSLKGIGATWLHGDRSRGLLTRRRLQALAQVYPAAPGGFPLSYHLVYGIIYRD
ncbi:malonyl-ACP O-methyltransferase BioC [Candidatus Symbiopectobacterium sp.]|uniref:malonyl-ACP O-methyltransferase BioC n=1 Tax=Candidatus Symbiopectobacterium sp. TaxID=2816440 RepID=UPI0025C32379|nr:malonyl-ACP O-methyltransferase BioC [Candidatus Symbiopectobacterium sp.]